MNLPMDSAAYESNMELMLADGARTALFDRHHPSSEHFRPRFILNDSSLGKKISAIIERELSKCSSFDFSVAFVTESGVIGLMQVLQELENAGVPGRILTTDYLAFSDPRALERLGRLSNIEVRMYPVGKNGKTRGFHTKGYIFHYPDGLSKALVGSANLTASALNVNHEWNLQFSSTENGELLTDIQNEFNRLWDESVSLDSYLETYKRMYEEKKAVLAKQPVVSFEQVKLEPNSMQISFISGLTESLERGEKRALLVSATGTGKTYAAAFAVRDLKPRRMLFLAHREQILKQSKASFERVLGPGSYGLLSGNSHDMDSNYLFATMQTMAKEDVLSHFKPDDFDVIVIDEVHRAGSDSYLRIMDYFNPSLFLGMTASPDRPDGFDIYKLFDNNIVQEIRLGQALEEDLLCPFHYFGITDFTVDGETVEEMTDFSYLVTDERINHIVDRAQYFGFSGKRVKGLIFCRTIEEAEELSVRLNEHGLRTLALSSKNSNPTQREQAIDRLVADEGSPLYEERLDYILSVDIFNEGVDIPEVNQVIMLRPTESPIIFVQQLGRGLRKADDKEFVVILDFIGNYANNYMIPLALSGNRSYNKDDMRKFVMEGERVIPGVSSVHFDEIARQRIFDSIDSSKLTMKMLKTSYTDLKHKLGRIPRMVDFHDHGEMDPMLYVDRERSYYRFLEKYEDEYAGTLSEDEQLVIEYLSRNIANGMRPHELLALLQIARGKRVDERILGESLQSFCAIDIDKTSFDSTVRILDKSFVTKNEKSTYANIEVIDFDGEYMGKGTSLEQFLVSAPFRKALADVIEFGLLRYREKYSTSGNPFELYEKYTRRDACRLLNWPTDDSSTVYGYRVKHGTCPIFVTYNKKEDIASSTQYEDEFIDPDTFSWMTRSRLTLASKEVKEIIEAERTGLEIHLFAKKSDNEGGDFYYLGRALPKNWKQTTIRDDDGEELPIVNFTLQLETTVKDDIYEYFAGDVA